MNSKLLQYDKDRTMKTMINKEQCAEAQWNNNMPFGPKQTTGILGHYSEAWAIASRLGVEACGSWWKPVEVVEVVGKQWKTCERHGKGWKGCGRVRRGAGGLEKVWKAVGKCGRDGKAQEGNATLQYLPLKAEPLRPKHCAVINKAGRSWSLVLHTHHHPK